ncbi:DUF5000 domain-containing lipoprotein [Parapedobacter sp. 10938]|uniref:DUF5000 domain-containing lipoprotein n=1 Tax=Parapedobacter flavus TaxID=3110225 RepID=UPI002DBADBC1|nr:DUF5000 domain-containing lipoprotein [Parapedobacter sp. 10938]MEC3878149.1 DUF5000 domain-containing lipoprotein [Parapedobacter sp. 10938]
MKPQYLIFFIGWLALATACQDTEPTPIENDGVPPGPVTQLEVNNLNGAAEISYQVPSDPDLLYVRAVYTTKQGEVRETKVSRHHRSLTVEGFADTDPYDVTLYAVDRGENASEPVRITVNPDRPPMQLARDSLEVIPTFGGISVTFKNSTLGDLAFVVLANDSLGEFAPLNTYYTRLREGEFAVRGLPSEETRFGLFVRDRWGNLSDTLYTFETPLFEVRLDPDQMKDYRLPTDAQLGYSGSVEALFDGILTDSRRGYHSGNSARMPQWFTFDMGVKAKISRMTYFMREGSFYYSLHNPRSFEIWGSNDPDPDGSFDSWELLLTYEQIKPSGLPSGQLSQEDIAAAEAGETVIFPIDVPEVRYIRFKTLRSWSNGTYVNFNELMIWGAPVN